jgi:spermidine synthase
MHTAGIRATMIFAAVINLANAIVLVSQRKTLHVPDYNRVEIQNKKEGMYSSKLLLFILLVFAIEGFCALGYEVIWTRILLGFSYDKSSYFISTIIISFVFGLAFGSFLIAGIVDRIKKLGTLFGWIEVAIGVSAILILPVFTYLVDYLNQLRPAYGDSWWHTMGYEYLLFFLVMLIPTTIMGMAYPVVSKIYTIHLSQLGNRLGKIGYLDTIGSIAGAFAAGFVLIPLFGVLQSTLVLAIGNIVLGIGLLIFTSDITRSAKGKQVALVVIIALLAFYLLPEQKYFRYWQTEQPADRLLFYQEGAGATVAVPQHLDGVTELAINGAVTAFAEYDDIQVHKLLAHLPYLLHTQPKRVLVIGLGMGVTSNSLVKTDSLMVDCVEISPEVRNAARQSFAKLNESVLEKSNFNLILDDGRSHLQITTNRYDIISSNAVNVRLSGNLYTTEFYRLCKQKLTNSGIMCQWLSTNWISESEYKMLLKSFLEVFPNTSLWCIDAGHLLLIGTAQPLQIDYQNFRYKINQDSVRFDLIDYGLSDPEAMLALYICSTPEITGYLGEIQDNTDDLPIVEMSRVVSMARNPRVIESLVAQKQTIAPIFKPGTLVHEDSLSVANHFLAEKLLLDATLKSRYQQKPMDALTLLLQAAQLAPNNYGIHKNLAILYHAGANPHQAVKSLVRAIHIHPKLAENHEQLGIILFNSGSYEGALHAFENALSLNPARPLSHYYRAAIFNLANNKLMAKSELKEVIKFFPKYIDAYYSLALIYEEQKDYERALEYYRHCYRLDHSYKNVAGKIEQLGQQSVH